MPTTHQSSTNSEDANTSEHKNTKKSRIKSSTWWKVTCIIFCCFQRIRRNSKHINTVNTKLVSNAICHWFEEIRYELNAFEINKCKMLT